MNFDELILNYCAITKMNKKLLIYTYVETVPLKSRESFFFGSVYIKVGFKRVKLYRMFL